MASRRSGRFRLLSGLVGIAGLLLASAWGQQPASSAALPPPATAATTSVAPVAAPDTPQSPGPSPDSAAAATPPQEAVPIHVDGEDSTPAATPADSPPETGEALFYSVPGASSDVSFEEHATQVAIIAPQCFALDRLGVLHGSLPPEVQDIARRNSVAVMPLVINYDFSRIGAEHMLRSPTDRDRAIGNLVETARDLNLDGWQLDFEGMSSSDRPYFTRFVKDAADALHRHGKLLSVAVAARTNDDPTSYTYRTFSGVYDYAALGESADFLSVMAYPESDTSHPGPLASYPWVQQVVEHVLESVPADKVSLGLPTYQTDWYERRVRVSVLQRIGKTVRRVFHYVYRLVRHSGPVTETEAEVQWDPVLRSSFRVEGEGHQRRITWLEDERSFEAKLELVAQYHLRGFSVWRIGLEDPKIWNQLPAATHATEPTASNDNSIHSSAPPISH